MKQIKGYEGLYEIDEKGNVYSLPRKGTWQKSPRKLKHFLSEYYYVMLCKDGKTKKKRLHRLLADNFIPNPKNKPIVNHKDGDKLNNSLDNLEWATNAENIRHAYKIGLIQPKRGGLNGNSVLTIDEVRQIRQIAYNRGKNYNRKELSLRYGVSECTIKEIVGRKTWQEA